MPGGYAGKILRVNLTNRTIFVDEPNELFYRQHVGGLGFVAHYLWNEVPPGADPLGPDNKLIFALGPFTGVPIAGNGRHCVGAKSPMTNAFGKGEVGGHWGAELKHAGFDAIIVEGRAATPAYLWVHDGEAEIKDASHLWGRFTKEVEETLRSELGDRSIKVTSIGPGGEKMVRFACVMCDLKDSAGRSGMGAVMGSKNLKAIAARGHNTPQLADREKVMAIGRWMSENYQTLARSLHEYGTGAMMVSHVGTGNLPTRNFRDGNLTDAIKIDATTLKTEIRIGMEGCFACPVRCKKVVQVGPPYNVDPAYGGPEYETLASMGSDCGVTDLKAVAKAHEICHAYSLDTISAGATVAFAMECFEDGLLTLQDTGGIDLRFGNAEALMAVMEKIGKREGIGDLLAEGTKLAAQKIGKGAEKFAMHVKGVEFGMHEPRLKQGLGLGYAVCAHGADHGCGLHDTFYDSDTPQLRAANILGIYEPLPLTDLSTRKVMMFKRLHQWTWLRDSLGMCSFVPYGHQQLMDLLAAVTGWNTSIYEEMLVGERIVTTARAYNMREGLTAADDRLPDRFHGGTAMGPLQNTPIDRAALDKAIHTYYALMGWDPQTGVPTQVKLEELGIPVAPVPMAAAR